MVAPLDVPPHAPRHDTVLRPACADRVSVAILDDHPIVCAHLRSILADDRSMNVLHVASHPDDLFASLNHTPCDVLVLDFSLPNARLDGTPLLKSLRRCHPAMLVIVFSSGKTLETRYAAYLAGAQAHMSKIEPPNCLPRLIHAVRQARDKFLYIDEGAIAVGVPTSPIQALTAWETETVRLLNRGMSVAQIAARLNRSPKTVSTHKQRAMGKLGLKTDLALAMYFKDIPDTLQ